MSSTITRYEWFYDAQQRRFLEQMVRAFSGFQWRTGRRNGAEPEFRLVPCRMASLDRMVAHITRNLSENTLNAVPMITIAQTGLVGRREDVQNPGHVDTRQVQERVVREDGTYGATRGNSYTVHRLMPRPFAMQMQVDIWTSNLDQKHQIAEQVLTVIYPTFDIQNSENGLDWSAMAMMTVEDITWSSRSIPIGTENEIDVMSIQLRLPMWLNPPAKVVEQKLIHQIITNISTATRDEEGELTPDGGIAQHVITHENRHLRVDRGTLTLLAEGGMERDSDGGTPNWLAWIGTHGPFRPAQTRIVLLPNGPDTLPEITGTVQADPSEPNLLSWQVDPASLPGNTLPPVDAIIDPLRTAPGIGLPAAEVGRRYLILEDIGTTQAWGPLDAKTGDIIEYAGLDGWRVVFQASVVTDEHYVLNLHTGRQLRWTGADWVMSVDGEYLPGYWRLVL